MKIILSHAPGAGGSHIAGMIGDGSGRLNEVTGRWHSDADLLKRQELEVHAGKLSIPTFQELVEDMFTKHDILCTHQIDWFTSMPGDIKRIRIYWNDHRLSRYICCRDINTLTIETVMPYFYKEGNTMWDIMKDFSVPVAKRANDFLSNHLLTNKSLIPGKLDLGDKWTHLCIDNILSMDFVEDLNVFCLENGLEFDSKRSEILHENWIAQNGHNRHNWDNAKLKLMNSSLFNQ